MPKETTEATDAEDEKKGWLDDPMVALYFVAGAFFVIAVILVIVYLFLKRKRLARPVDYAWRRYMKTEKAEERRTKTEQASHAQTTQAESVDSIPNSKLNTAFSDRDFNFNTTFSKHYTSTPAATYPANPPLNTTYTVSDQHARAYEMKMFN